jgi:Predicted permeases
MQITFKTFMILCPLIFLAGFVDSIAGGGGLISLPSYLFVGLPIHFAYGTNKFTSSLGTFFSAARFIRNRQINYKSTAASVCGALIGSFIGAKAALALSDKYLQYCLMVLLPVIAIFTLSRRGFGESNTVAEMSDKKMVVLSVISGLLIGAYDGFFGPGTGTFLILVYTTILGFNLTMASGNAKIVNLSSNLAALVTFIAGGKVMFLIGIPAAVFGILGNWIGSGLAVKSGAKVIKPVFISVIVLLFIKISLDLFK